MSRCQAWQSVCRALGFHPIHLRNFCAKVKYLGFLDFVWLLPTYFLVWMASKEICACVAMWSDDSWTKCHTRCDWTWFLVIFYYLIINIVEVGNHQWGQVSFVATLLHTNCLWSYFNVTATHPECCWVMVYVPFSLCLIADTNVQHLVRVCVYVCCWHMTVNLHYSDLPWVRNISAFTDCGGGCSGNALMVDWAGTSVAK